MTIDETGHAARGTYTGHAAAEELEAAWETLRLRWLELGGVWADVVHDRFEREHWAPLEMRTLSAGQALGELRRIIAQVRRNVR